MKKTIIVLLAISIFLSAAGLATATSVQPDQELKVIAPGTCGFFDLNVTSSDTETAYLTWNADAPLTARINPSDPILDPLGLTGRTYNFGITSGVSQIKNMDVCMPTGTPSGEYYIWVEYFGNHGGKFRVKAVTEPAVITPELPTSALMSVGLMGLFGMAYLRRKN
jgi:hypothetical protein